MYGHPAISKKTITVLLLIVIMTANCAHRPFVKPAGEVVGSCEGIMQSASGAHSRFIFKLYHMQDSGDDPFRLYFILPGKTGLLPVEDLEFDDDKMRVVAGSGKTRAYEGTISGKPLKFKGSMKGVKGAFTFDIKEFMEK